MESPASPPPSQVPMGAPPGWRPMSGLALTAFVVSILMLVSVMTGWWWLTVVPFLFACYAAYKAVPERYRGRGLAIAGIVICALLGSCSFMSQKLMLDMSSHLAQEVLRPLAAEDITEDERDHRLKDWILESAVHDGRLEEIKARFAQVVERMGAYQGEVSAGTMFTGLFPVVIGPQDPSLVQVDDPDAGTDAVVPGQAFWSLARFEKGEVRVAVFLDTRKDTEALGKAMGEGSKARVVRDLRFYLPAP